MHPSIPLSWATAVNSPQAARAYAFELASQTPGGELQAFGIAPHAQAGTADWTAINFVDPDEALSPTTVFAGIPVGNTPELWGTYTPRLALHNFSSLPQTVSLTLASAGAGLPVPIKSFLLAAAQSASIDLAGVTGDSALLNTLTVSGYGCNLGPSQTARSVQGTDRRQIAWINQRHVSEDALNDAITTVINAYNNFALPRLWGSGKHAAADGTRWDLYEQNLLSEYHIRYGGYGGIGYYHVSDKYIALFSHFIPCGVWEAVYILDGLLKNESDIQPDVLHADTQGQSEPVFALAHLLGIELMPRIRNWKNLDMCRPDRNGHYDHIDSLFTENVDWSLIETHLPDMLRVALSIKAGRISASTILRRLGTYSRKNRLYQAFCELGRVIRTGFLLRYISDSQLRSTIQGATHKSEALNRFLKWTFFGGEGIIAENSRDEQRKAIQYNHLVANCLIFHNLCSLTRLVQTLEKRGETVPEDAIAAISRYLTEHINRFGDYILNLGRKPPQPDYGYTLKRTTSAR